MNNLRAADGICDKREKIYKGSIELVIDNLESLKVSNKESISENVDSEKESGEKEVHNHQKNPYGSKKLTITAEKLTLETLFLL